MDTDIISPSLTALLVVIVIFSILIIAVVGYRRKQAHNVVRRCMAVWAAQGPFDSGEKSSAAMRAAYQAVLGLEQANKHEPDFANHAAAYDQDPETWESLRQQAEECIDKENDERVVIAKGYAAMESLNKEYLENAGHRLEPTVDSDGNVQIAYKQTLSDEEIEKRDHERNERIIRGIGDGLLNQETPEAQALVAFLTNVARASGKTEPDTPINIGHAYCICLDLKHEDPDDELAKQFTRLEEAWSKITPAPVGEWSETPGAHEQHLLRRRNSPYFPESRQVITEEELEHAKSQDIKDYRYAKCWLDKILQRVEEIHGNVSSGKLNELREELQDLIDFASGAGQLCSDLVTTAESLRSAIVADIRSGFEGNQEALDLVNKAEDYHEKRLQTFQIPLLAQLARDKSPIPEDETINAIVSEDPETIAAAMSLMPEEKRALIEYHGLQMLKEAMDSGNVDPDLEGKIHAISSEDTVP